MKNATWERTQGSHHYDISFYFIAFGINPDSFKKKRHAKKYFKKYILPKLKDSSIVNMTMSGIEVGEL